MPFRLFPCLALLFAGLLGGCVTHIRTDIAENPPPAEKFSDFNRFELVPVALSAEDQTYAANRKAVAKIQQDVDKTMEPVLARWNAAGRQEGGPPRTLLIEPTIGQIKYLNATVRVWAGALSGSSAVILNARITEKESGRLIANPLFYARAAAMGGAWTFGVTDNLMLLRIADRLTSYLQANYAAAVGGPTGAKAK